MLFDPKVLRPGLKEHPEPKILSCYGEMQARLPAADPAAETSIAEESSGNSGLRVQLRTVCCGF